MQIMLFTSPTCGPCKMLKPTLAKLQSIYKFHMTVYEASPFTQAKFIEHSVRTVPTVICIKQDGSEHIFTGNRSEKEVESLLKSWGAVPL